MKAAIYHGPRDIRVESVPDPKIRDAGDAIVRVVNAAICGSDLWPYRGVADRKPGTRIGHEFIGVVEEAGAAVSGFKRGDVVAAPFCYSDNDCDLCNAGLQTSCHNGGYWGSDGNDGGQGEFVRVPLADGTLRPIPAAVAHDERKRASALTLTDVMSTGHHGCVRAGVKAGSTVAVIGDGAVGLCAIISAKRSNAARVFAIGHHAARLELARSLGATDIIDSKDPQAAQQIIDATGGGVNCVVEAVGSQATMDLGVSIVRPGGTLAFVGVPYGVSTFDARKLFSDNVTIAGALAPTRLYIDELMADVVTGTIDPGAVLTMRLPLADAPRGYKAMDDRSTIKVMLEISAV